MGAWGVEPWENDAAADWYGELFEKTKFAEYVEKTLKSDVTNNCDEIRAAAYLLATLGNVYIWPVEVLEKQLKLAVEKLETILSKHGCPLNENENFVNAIKKEIEVLKNRLPKRS